MTKDRLLPDGNDEVDEIDELESSTLSVCQEPANASVLVFDLSDETTRMAAGVLAQSLPQVAEGLKIAEELNMRLLFIAMQRAEQRVTCVPVQDLDRVSKALSALTDVVSASTGAVAWVFLPDSIAPEILPHLELLQELWSSRTQGLVH